MAETIQETKPPEPPPKPPELPRSTEPRGAAGDSGTGQRDTQTSAHDDTNAAIRAEYAKAKGDTSSGPDGDGSTAGDDTRNSLRPTPEFQQGLDDFRANKTAAGTEQDRGDGSIPAQRVSPDQEVPGGPGLAPTPEFQQKLDDHRENWDARKAAGEHALSEQEAAPPGSGQQAVEYGNTQAAAAQQFEAAKAQQSPRDTVPADVVEPPPDGSAPPAPQDVTPTVPQADTDEPVAAPQADTDEPVAAPVQDNGSLTPAVGDELDSRQTQIPVEQTPVESADPQPTMEVTDPVAGLSDSGREAYDTLRSAVDRAAARTPDDVRSTLSRAQLTAGQEEPWLRAMYVGSDLENAVANDGEVLSNPNIAHLGTERPGQSVADFVVKDQNGDMGIDVSGGSQSTIRAHLGREYIDSRSQVLDYPTFSPEFLNEVFR